MRFSMIFTPMRRQPSWLRNDPASDMNSSPLFNVGFVVWRESVEALLVIGILSAWLTAGGTAMRGERRYLWGGVIAGLASAMVIGIALLALGDSLSEGAQQTYRTLMMLMAAALIIQMLFWMRRHGRSLRRDLEGALSQAAANSHHWTVFLLAALAVAREGSETVIFLYGTLSASVAMAGWSGWWISGLASVGGFIAALATYGLLQAGVRWLSWRVFFKITEIMLLLLAGSLLVGGVEGLIEIDILPSLANRLWDSSHIIPDSGIGGGLLASLTGYRAQPNLMETLIFFAYWLVVPWLLTRSMTIKTRRA